MDWVTVQDDAPLVPPPGTGECRLHGDWCLQEADGHGACGGDRKGKRKERMEEETVESELKEQGIVVEQREFKEEARWSGYIPGPLAAVGGESMGDTHYPPVHETYYPSIATPSGPRKRMKALVRRFVPPAAPVAELVAVPVAEVIIISSDDE